MESFDHNFAREVKLLAIYISAFRNSKTILKLEVLALKGDAISKCYRNKLLPLLLKGQMLLVMMVQSKFDLPTIFRENSGA